MIYCSYSDVILGILFRVVHFGSSGDAEHGRGLWDHVGPFINPLYSDGFSIQIDTIIMGLSIVYSKGSQVKLSK